MIKFNLDLKNLRDFDFQNGQWISTKTSIEVFCSPMLEYFSISNGALTAFVVREKETGQSMDRSIFLKTSEAEYCQEIEKIKSWKLEYFLIEINSENSTICLSRGSIDKVAIYYTINNGKLIGSWDLTDLHEFINQSDPFDRAEILLFLAGMPVYNHKTIYKNIFKITERSKILFGNRGVEVFLPKNAELFEESILKPDIDPTEAFYGILENQLTHYRTLLELPANEIGCELSGGLDSAIVAMLVSDFFKRNGINCYTLLLSGDMGKQQQIRTSEIIGGWNLKSNSINIDDFGGPLKQSGFLLRNGMISVYEEIYYDLQSILLNNAEKHGVKVIFNGIGGDDVLFSIAHSSKSKQVRDIGDHVKKLNIFSGVDEIRNIIQNISTFPRPFIPISSLNASHSRSAMYLRKNLWPIELFCSQDIITFFQLLPSDLKNGKNLHKKLLKSNGFSDLFTNPKIKEHFGLVFDKSMKIDNRKEVINLIRESKLHDMGIIKKDIFLEQYDRYCEMNDHSVPPILYYTVAAIEYNLISLSS